MLTHGWAVGEGFDEPIRQVPRMRGDEPEPADRGPAIGRPKAIDRADQFGQVRAAGEIEPTAGPPGSVDVPEAWIRGQIVPVRIDVLAEQGDFLVPGGRDGARLVHDVVERTAALRAAAERHDAVGTGLVAAVDDRQPGGDRRATRYRPIPDRPCPAGRQMIRHADDRSTDRRGRSDVAHRRLGRSEAEPIDQFGLLVGPKELVHRRVATLEACSIRLTDGAAGQDDPQTRVGSLEVGQLAHPADDLLLGALTDGAAVDHDEIRVGEVGCLPAAGLQEPTDHLLGVAPVHLAAERPDVESRQDPGLRQVLEQTCIVGRRRLARWGRVRRDGRIEHRQGTGHRRPSIHRGAPGAAAPTSPVAAPGIPRATSGGTQRPA